MSLGNKAGLSEADVLEALGDDPDTKVIIGYLESVDDGEKFLRKAQQVTEKKPVIMIKAGTTQSGARATSSHTGSIAGSVVASTAAFRQAGIIQVHDLEALFDLARALPSNHCRKDQISQWSPTLWSRHSGRRRL